MKDLISRQAALDLIADYDLSMGQVVRGIHALQSVTPPEEELEKIKEEFEEIKGQRYNPYNNKTEYSVSMKELREVFDKHIAELKGENNG